MARNQEQIEFAQGEGWKLLTNTDVTELSLQIRKGTLEIRVGTDIEPADADKGWIYQRADGELQRKLTGIAYGGGTRLWGRALGGEAWALVDHA